MLDQPGYWPQKKPTCKGRFVVVGLALTACSMALFLASMVMLVHPNRGEIVVTTLPPTTQPLTMLFILSLNEAEGCLFSSFIILPLS